MRLSRLIGIVLFVALVAGGSFALRAYLDTLALPSLQVTPQPTDTGLVAATLPTTALPALPSATASPTVATQSTPAAKSGATQTTGPTPTATAGVLRIIVASPTPPPSASPSIGKATPSPTATAVRPPAAAASPVVAKAAGAAGPTGDRIVWSQASGEARDLWLMAADGSNPAPLTTGNVRNREPAVSPDGRTIAFTSNRDGNNEIYIIGTEGGNLVRLTNNPANDYAPAWSPDGRSIAFVSNRDGNDNIYVMRADGGNQTRLTDFGGFDGQPAWSPDGRLIAFTSNRDHDLNIYVMPARGGTPTRLTSDRGDDRDPAWSPDGSALAFVSNRSGQFQVYVMKADGSEQRALTNMAKGADHPSWGPATPGRSGLGAFTLAFVAYTGDASAAAAAEIYTMRGDGSDQRRLTTNTVEDADPAWIVTSSPVALALTATMPPSPPIGKTPAPASPTGSATTGPTPVPSSVAVTEIIIDELSPQFSRGGTPKYWKEANIGHGNHMLYTYNSAKQDNWGRWTPTLPQPGQYEVFVFIPAQNATTRRATYTIAHAGRQDKQVINQLLYENEWLSLGIYSFTAKGGEYVQLTDVTGEAKNTKRIGFDAVKFVYRGQ